MFDAGSIGIQHTDRTARTNGGSSSHQRQTSPSKGCPHLSHCGDGSSASLDQQSPHTTPLSEGVISMSHDTHALGRKRSRAPR